MTPNEHHIKTPRTARMYTLGTFDGKGKHLWIVAHGYRHLAKDFINFFQPIADEKTIVVAPEGLSRFYLNGFAGPVGATWMTREDRVNEIYDYVEYLDNVTECMIERLDAPPSRITALGFSQGCPTITRWAAMGSVQPDDVVLWGGDTPTDLDFAAYTERMKKKTTRFVIGKNDDVITKDVFDLSVKLIKDNGLATTETYFEGGHTIPSDVLLQLKQDISNH
ncbi:MAG TPA: phospholipase [Candidatus Kapabacteria bacterium]|nr:phospholipase [Candidatus Kapabacteria bacterium]